MKTLFSTLLAASLLAAPMAQAGRCEQNPRPLPVPAVAIYPSKVSYRDILNRCTNLVSELRSAQRQAGLMARAGSLSKAAAHMLAALNQKNREVRPWQESQNPHTVEAIRAANEVAMTAFEAADQSQRKLGSKLVGQVKYMTLSELYQIIFEAYEYLDVHYYGSIYENCGGYRCDSGAYDYLPYDYYERISDLAGRILNLQVKLGPAQADDAVELKISQAVARAAKFILLQSVYRRDFACVITDLHNLDREIGQEMCHSTIPSDWYVDQVRSQIRSAANSIHRCGY
ncbi:hypothetical protein [Bdellovibrio sp. HCB2-146]|uniref:hypothetical protein n=1 Tax=Bdellovibrio sp. HCB2-146 TaxID=3394362 RepID=UPI0039BC5378